MLQHQSDQFCFALLAGELERTQTLRFVGYAQAQVAAVWEEEERDRFGFTAAVGCAGWVQRRVIAILKKNQLLTTLQITSMLSIIV